VSSKTSCGSILIS